MSEHRFLTAEQAVSLLHDGEYVHNMRGGIGLMMGADWSREEAEKAFRDAESIELGGPNAYAMKHPIAVTEKSGRLSFFEADMDKVAAFEAAEAV